MKILFFSIELVSSTFIETQVNQISKNNEILYLYLYGKDEKKYNFKSKKIEKKTNNYIEKIYGFLERHDISYNHLKDKNLKNQISEEVKIFEPDIIYCQFAYDALWLIENYYNPSMKYIIHVRGYDVSNKLESRIYRKKLKNILSKKNIFVISVCEHLINNLIDKEIIPYNQPSVIHSSTDINFFKRMQEPDKDFFTFIQVSSFRPKKGHEFSIHAIKLFLDKLGTDRDNVKFIFTGFDLNNIRAKAILDIVYTLQVEKNISFIGWQTPAQTKALLEKSHVIHQHSVTTADMDQEGIPNALMEGMAMDLPVISTIHAGIPELVDVSADGVLVHERDIENYANAFLVIYNNWELSQKNRKIIKENFSKENFEKKIQAKLDCIHKMTLD
ncbi:MAG: glycosyltransferase family 4 protein [Methylococcales bacterium]|nr:glycosyltransferase family 4 protein [Methylococcales bacterium]